MKSALLSLVFLLASCGPAATPPAPAAPVSPSTPVSSDPAPTPAVTGSCSADETGPGVFKVLENERIGGLGMGMTPADVTAIVGEPTLKEGPTDNAAMGGRDWTWNFHGRGLELGFWSETDWAAAKLNSITITVGNRLTTRFGIGVGSTEADAKKAYGPCLSKDDNEPGQLVAGSVYGGVIITTENGFVTSIFVGAAGE